MSPATNHPTVFNASAIVVDPAEVLCIGAELAAARQRRGLSLAQCAERLSMPSQVLRRLEAGTLSPLDSGVFLRGHLRAYGTLLDIDSATLDDYVRRLAPEAPPALLASGRMPSSRYVVERYLRAASYIVLTVAITAPIVLLVMHSESTRSGARLQAIDSAPVPLVPRLGTAHAAHIPGVAVILPPVAAQPQSRQPLLATMTPFISGDAETTIPAPVPAVTGAHTLALTLSAPSWVEVTGADGKRLEYALLQPGTYSWQDAAPLQVLIGNAAAASVTVDGKPFALDDISASNVARFSIGPAPGNA
ncbi:RodZ domain-containing protein [Metallibacterium sp.]